MNNNNNFNNDPYLNDNITLPVQRHNEGSIDPNQYYQQSLNI